MSILEKSEIFPKDARDEMDLSDAPRCAHCGKKHDSRNGIMHLIAHCTDNDGKVYKAAITVCREGPCKVMIMDGSPNDVGLNGIWLPGGWMRERRHLGDLFFYCFEFFRNNQDTGPHDLVDLFAVLMVNRSQRWEAHERQEMARQIAEAVEQRLIMVSAEQDNQPIVDVTAGHA